MRTGPGAALFLMCLALPLAAQQQETPRVEISGGYTYVRANAPPGNCGCFSANGGSASLAYNVTPHLGLASDLAVVHNGNVNGSNIGLTLTSYTFGPQYSWRVSSLTPFGHILVGGAHEAAGQVDASAFAMNLGGGLDLRLSHRWSLRLLEADYYLTHFANSVNSHQNNLRLGAGVVFKF
jgi:outer membrane immunogenic protein